MTDTAIPMGIATANPRTSRCREARKSMMPSSRFQPAWKLGIAAYSFTSVAGSTERYSLASCVIVSSRGRLVSRGGATGKKAKITRPRPPDTRQTLRSRR